ncbi:hypothetical protein J3E07_000538 [Methanococcus voltae]|uniref:Cellulosome anchoring protein cohesin region n=1 Tax=Methanococcus voltae TaxID=2188 RepID=A0A8J7S0H4_METVO|nr:PKD domain-containing protein [Methanococcus voltae]MBP2201140.1 hypothetical protein [Methanococcus voltae]
MVIKNKIKLKFSICLITLLFMLFIIPNSCMAITPNTDYKMSLEPNSKTIGVGDSFDIVLWGNTPKVSAIQSKFNYDTSMLELTNIELGSISDSASSKRTDLSSSLITMLWFDPSTAPEGYYKIATLSFKVLKGGNTTIIPRSYEFSDNRGVSVIPVINSANIMVSGGMKAELILNTPKPNVDNSAVLKIYGIDVSDPNLKNITGSFNFNADNNNNVELIGNYDIKVANSQYNYYMIDTSKNSFVISLKDVLDENYDKSYTFNEIIEIPLKLNNIVEDPKNTILYNVSVGDRTILDKKVFYDSSTILDNKPYFAIVPAGSSTAVSSTDLKFCTYEKFRLKAFNMKDNNLTKFSGYIFVDEDKFSADQFKISQFSTVYDKVNYSELEINESYLKYNLTLSKGIEEESYTVLEFRITPSNNQDSSSPLILGNFSVENNDTKVNVDTKDITVNILEKEENMPPSISIGYAISDNNYVSFLPFMIDSDDDTEDLELEWKFGDGDDSTMDEPSHKYDYGQYSVSCTVNDKLDATDSVRGHLILKEYNILNYTFENLRANLTNSNNSNNLNNVNSANNITYKATFELHNPLSADVSAYATFKNPKGYKLIENSTTGKSLNKIIIPANEKRNLTMLITSSSKKPFDVKWDVKYYPSSKTQDDDFYIQYYEWNFVEKSFEGVITSINSPKYKDITLGNQEMTFKVNRVPEIKEYEITKKIEVISPNSVVLYLILTVISFTMGLSFAIVVKNPRNRRILLYRLRNNFRKIYDHIRGY